MWHCISSLDVNCKFFVLPRYTFLARGGIAYHPLMSIASENKGSTSAVDNPWHCISSLDVKLQSYSGIAYHPLMSIAREGRFTYSIRTRTEVALHIIP